MTTPSPELVADPPGMALRRLYRTLFLRGRTSRGMNRETAPKSVARKLAMTLLFYAAFGLLAFSFVGRPVFALSLYLHATTFVFLGMFVAASAGEVLFNREEADILMHRPVGPRTLLWAKVRVIVEVSLWIAGAFNLAGIFVGLTSPDGGWRFPVAHAVSTVMEALFCAGCVVLVYQLCLRWFGRERLNGLMTTAQVIVSVAAVLAGQVLPRLTRGIGGLVKFDERSWWVTLLPPTWFAGLDDALAGSGSGTAWLLSVAAMIATASVLATALGKLARDYEVGLQSLGEASFGHPPKGSRRRWLDALANRPPFSWMLPDPVSRASFLLTAAYLARDRDTKLRFYPGVAPMLVVPLMLLMGNRKASGADAFSLAAMGAFLGVLPMVALSLLQYSDQWQASDVFRVAPVPGPDPICRGARQAVLWLFAVPALLAFAAVLWLIRGDPAQLLLLLPGAIVLPIYCLWPHLGGKAVPLSQASETSKSARRGLTVVAGMLSSMAIAGVSLAARKLGIFAWFIAAECVIVLAVHWWLKSVLRRTSWPSIE